MWFQNVLADAVVRGGKIKKQFVKGVLGSKALEEILSNETVLRSVSKAFSTKNQLEKSLRQNLRKALKLIDIPSREDIRNMQSKIHQLETEMDGIHRKITHNRRGPKAAKKKPLRSR